MSEVMEQKKSRKMSKAIVGIAAICLILALTGCEDNNYLTLKDSDETEQTEDIADYETNNETEIETESAYTGVPIYQVNTSASNLNVRENPNADSDIIAKLSNGELVYGTGETSGGWIQVYCSSNDTNQDKTGWASGDYLLAVTDQGQETEAVKQAETEVVKQAESEAVKQAETPQDNEEITAEAISTQIEEQLKQAQKDVTIEDYRSWFSDIVQALDAGDIAAASELLGSNISEENAEAARWTFNLYLQWIDKGYIVLDESGKLTYTEAGEQAAEEELEQEMYAWIEQHLCGNCGGSGLILIDNRTVCPICGGSGMQYIPNAMYDTIMGWQGTYVVCSGCSGSGYTGSAYYDTCSICNGEGYNY